MAKTWRFESTPSDLNLGGNFSDIMAEVGSGTRQLQASNGGGTAAGFYVSPLADDLAGQFNGGLWTVVLNVSSAASGTVISTVRVERYSSGGLFRAGVTMAPLNESTATTGDKTFTVSNPALGTWDPGDRLAVRVLVRNDNPHGGAAGPTFDLAAANTRIDTPFTFVVGPIQRSAADVETLVDAASKVVSSGRSADEVEILDDLIAFSKTATRPQTDVLDLGDTVSAATGYKREVADVETLADAGTFVLNSPGDSLGLSDSITAVVTSARSEADVLALADGTTKVGTFARSATDQETLADVASRGVAYERPQVDVETLADVSQQVAVQARTVADLGTLSDVLLYDAAGMVTRSASDLLTLGDDKIPAGGLLDIPGWLYLFDPDEIVLNDNDPVAMWPDLSGNGRDLSQVDSLKQPLLKKNVLNGHDVVRFLNSSLATAAFAEEAQPNTLFIVFNCANFVASAVTPASGLDQNTHNSIQVGGSSNNKLTYAAPDGKRDGPLSAGVFTIVSAIFDGASSRLFKDGVDVTPVGNPGSQGMIGVTLGSSYLQNGLFLDGDIAFYGLVDSRLSEVDRHAVESTLSSRFAIPVPGGPTVIQSSVRSPDDFLILTDASSPFIVYSRTPTDVETLADGTSQFHDVGGGPIIRSASDVLSLADAVVAIASMVRSAVDVETLADTHTSTATAARSLSDIETLSDAAAWLSSMVRPVGDVESLSDSAVRLAVMVRALADVETLVDSMSQTSAAPNQRIASDVLSLSDAQQRVTSMLRSVSDIETLMDFLQSSISYLRTQSDILALEDVFLPVGSYVKSASDQLLLSDGILAPSSLNRSPGDVLTLQDTSTLVATYSRTLIDLLQLVDLLTYAGISGEFVKVVQVVVRRVYEAGIDRTHGAGDPAP